MSERVSDKQLERLAVMHFGVDFLPNREEFIDIQLCLRELQQLRRSASSASQPGAQGERPWCNRHDLDFVRYKSGAISEKCPKCSRHSPECASPTACHYDATSAQTEARTREGDVDEALVSVENPFTSGATLAEARTLAAEVRRLRSQPKTLSGERQFSDDERAALLCSIAAMERVNARDKNFSVSYGDIAILRKLAGGGEG